MDEHHPKETDEMDGAVDEFLIHRPDGKINRLIFMDQTNAIEQQLDVEGYEKKTVVMLGLKKFCEMAKINVPDEVLDDAIEQAVFTMKQLAKLTLGEEDDAFIDKLTSGMEGAG